MKHLVIEIKNVGMENMMYDNPENISLNEIMRKMRNLGCGPNRNKRFNILYNYSFDMISKEEWIKKYCK